MKFLAAFCLTLVLCIVIEQSFADSECTDGDNKRDKCNNCKCVNGLWACTRKHCLERRETRCSPGKSFPHSDGCNSCVCSADGKNAACTLKLCV